MSFRQELETILSIIAPWSTTGGVSPVAHPGVDFDPQNATHTAPFTPGGEYVAWDVRHSEAETVAKGNGPERMYHGVIIARILVPVASGKIPAVTGAGRAAELADLWAAQFRGLGQVNGMAFEPPGWSTPVGIVPAGTHYQQNVYQPFRRRELFAEGS